MSKFLKMTHITADNTHIAELINTVKAIISKQKQQTAALMKANTYTAAFKFRVAAAATEFFLICKVSTCLTKEIIVRCFNTISENYAQSIAQLVKKINKKKSQNIFRKMLAVRKLLSRNIMMIIN